MDLDSLYSNGTTDALTARQLHERALLEAVPRGPVLAQDHGDRGHRRAVHRPGEGHVDVRPVARQRALQLADLLRGVRQRLARGAQQLGLLRQARLLPLDRQARARTRSWSASTTSRNRGKVDNYQSGSGYRVYATKTYIADTPDRTIYPVIDGSSYIQYTPLVAPQRWQRHPHLLAVRQRPVAPQQQAVVQHRLPLRPEPLEGPGRRAGAEGLAVESAPGRQLRHQGRRKVDRERRVRPLRHGRQRRGGRLGIAGRPDGLLLVDLYRAEAQHHVHGAELPDDAADILPQVFAWFDGNRRHQQHELPERAVDSRRHHARSAPARRPRRVPTRSTRRPGARTGPDRGTVRVDYVYRKYHDMYGSYIDMTTGKVTDPTGRSYDAEIIKNTPDAQRWYHGSDGVGDLPADTAHHPRAATTRCRTRRATTTARTSAAGRSWPASMTSPSTSRKRGTGRPAT